MKNIVRFPLLILIIICTQNSMGKDILPPEHIVFSYSKTPSTTYMDFKRISLIKTLLPGLKYEIRIQSFGELSRPPKLNLQFIGLDYARIPGAAKTLSFGTTPFLVPEEATCVQLKVNNKLFRQIQSITIRALPTMMKEGKVNWNSGWESYLIWYPRDICEKKSTFYTRKTIEINDIENISDVKLIVAAADQCVLHVNGSQIGIIKRARKAKVYEIKNKLKKGNNIIAFEVTNNNSPAVMSMETSINYNDGKARKIITDDSWKISDKPIAGWKKNDFNDSSWVYAEIVGTPPYPLVNRSTPYKGCDLVQMYWNTSAYVSRPYIGPIDQMTVDQMETNVGMRGIRTGDKIDILINYTFPVKTKIPHELILELYNSKGEYLFDLSAAINIPKYSLGTKKSIQSIDVPQFLNSGRYNIKLVDKKNSIKLSSQGKGNQIPLNIAKSTAKRFPKSELANRNGLVLLNVDNQTIPFTSYSYFHWGQPGFAGNGLKKLDAATGGPFIANSIKFNSYWVSENKYDFSHIDTFMYRYLYNFNPSVKIMVDINMDPPGWWRSANPEELTVLSDKTIIKTRQSPASKKWLHDSGNALKAFIRHLASSGYADRVIAVRPTAWGPEWLGPGRSDVLPDYSEPAKNAFRQWLRMKYQTDKHLQAAWRQKAITFGTVEVPSFHERQGDGSKGIFLNYRAQQNVVDYHKYYNDIFADAVIHFCKIIKEESVNRLLAGTYYGYSLYIKSPRLFNSGHFSLQKVLASPHVDFVASPAPYGISRRPGKPGSYMVPFASAGIAGKMYLVEVDLRTFLSRDVNKGHSRHIVRPSTVWDSVALMKRSLIKNITSGLSYYWYDFGTGDYNNKSLLKVIDIGKKISKLNIKLMDRRHGNDIAVIVDERSGAFQRFSPAKNVQYSVNLWGAEVSHLSLNTLGTPVDIYDFSSLYSDDFPEYKCVYFLNSCYLTQRDRDIIRRKLFKNNTLVIFKNAIGLFDEENMSAENIVDITGINVKVDWQETSQVVQYINSDSVIGIMRSKPAPLRRDMLIANPPNKYGDDKRFNPGIYVDDKSAKVIAIFDDSKKTAVAFKQFSDWSVVYMASPIPIKQNVLKSILKFAKVHFYSEQIGDCVYANDHFLGLHSSVGGEKRIVLNNVAPVVYDVFKKKILAENCKVFVYNHKAGDTNVFYMGPKWSSKNGQ